MYLVIILKQGNKPQQIGRKYDDKTFFSSKATVI